MPLVRAGLERLLLLVFWVARGAFVLQGVAFGCASVAALAWSPLETPAWLRSAMVSALLLSGTFFAAGLLLIAARRWHASPTSGGLGPAWSWPALLSVSLLALAALSAVVASGLPALWNSIATHLAAIGPWDDMARLGPYSGLVMLPIILSLLVPALVTAAAVFSIALPLALFPLVVTRSRLVPTLLAMGVICQAALVLTGWLAADAFARLAEQAYAAMTASGDAEVLRVAEEIARATIVLTRTATALVAPMLGMLAWLTFLRPSGGAAAFFADGTKPAPAAAFHAAPSVPRSRVPVMPVAEVPEASILDVAKPPPEPGAGARRAGLALGVLGALMLVFGAADRLRTRASYVSSEPAPGATLAGPPAAVRVRFATALDPASSLSITRLVVQPSAGGEPGHVESARRLAPDDPDRRTIEVLPSRLSDGLYRVTWQALPEGGGVPRHGSFSFGVGVSVPAGTADSSHSLRERDADARGRRQILVGGALLIVLGALSALRSPPSPRP